ILPASTNSRFCSGFVILPSPSFADVSECTKTTSNTFLDWIEQTGADRFGHTFNEVPSAFYPAIIDGGFKLLNFRAGLEIDSVVKHRSGFPQAGHLPVRQRIRCELDRFICLILGRSPLCRFEVPDQPVL